MEQSGSLAEMKTVRFLLPSGQQGILDEQRTIVMGKGNGIVVIKAREWLQDKCPKVRLILIKIDRTGAVI